MLTGFRDLDSLTGGFSPGDLVLLGGESGTGKSAFALNAALQSAQYGAEVAVLSFETNSDRIWMRIFSALTSVPLSAMLGVGPSKSDWPALLRGPHNPSISRLQALGIANLAGNTVGDVRRSVRKISELRVRSGGARLSLVVVDPLRLMGSVTVMPERERRREQAAIVIRLKRMARDLGVCVFLVGDLDHVVGRSESEPHGSSDADAFGITRDFVDKVLVLRRGVEPGAAPTESTDAEILVTQRGGPTGTVGLTWHRDRGLFRSLPRRDVPTEG